MSEKNQGPDQPKGNESSKEIIRKKRKKGGPSKAASAASPSKERIHSKENALDPAPATLEPTQAALKSAPETAAEPRCPNKPTVFIAPPPPTTKASKKNKNKKPAAEPEETPMETNVNLKRRDSGEGSSKKICPNTPPQQDPRKAHLPWCHNLPIINLPHRLNHNLPQSTSKSSSYSISSLTHPLLSLLSITLYEPVSIRNETPFSHYRQTNPAESQVGLAGDKQ